MGLLGLQSCPLGILLLCVVSSDAYGEKLRQSPSALRSARTNPYAHATQEVVQVSNSIPEAFAGAGRSRQTNFRREDGQGSVPVQSLADTDKCRGGEVHENGMCVPEAQSHQRSRPSSSRTVLKPKVDRAALFRRTARTSTTTTTTPPPIQAEKPSGAEGSPDSDPCQQAESACLERRQRKSRHRFKTAASQDTSPSEPRTTTSTTTTTTTEPPTTTRRALPITMARLQKSSRALDVSSTSTPTPDRSRILFENFYQAGDHPASPQQALTVCGDGLCASDDDFLSGKTTERSTTAPKRQSVQIIEQPVAAQASKPSYNSSPIRPYGRPQHLSHAHDSNPFDSEEQLQEFQLDGRESTRQHTKLPSTLGEPAVKHYSDTSDSSVGRVALHQRTRNAQQPRSNTSTVRSRGEKQSPPKVARRGQNPSTSLRADGSDVDETVVGYNYNRPTRPFPSPAITSRSEPIDAQPFNEFSRYDLPHTGASRASYSNVAPVVEDVPYIDNSPPINTIAMQESESTRDEVRSAAQPITREVLETGPFSNSDELQTELSNNAAMQASERVPVPRRENMELVEQNSRASILLPVPIRHPFKQSFNMREVTPFMGDQKVSANEQYIDHRFPQPGGPLPQQLPAQVKQGSGYTLTHPAENGYMLPLTSVPYMGYSIQPIPNGTPQQPPTQALMMVSQQSQKEEQQANYAAHAILGALHLQAEMLQRQQAQPVRSEHVTAFGQSADPQLTLTSHIQTSILNEHDSYSHGNKLPAGSTTERPRENVSRKKKNKKKNGSDEGSRKIRPSIDNDDSFSFTNGEIVFERPIREPEITFERPIQRKPFKPFHHPDLVYMDGPMRPSFNGPHSHRSGGNLRMKPKPHLTRVPYEIITLNRQKRQDGYIYPRPTPSGPGLEGGAVAPESRPKEGEGYDYPRPAAPFTPAAPGPSPTPAPGPIVSPGAEPGPATGIPPPSPGPGSPSEPGVFPTAPVPVRPKPTPPPALTPGPQTTPSEGEGYDYPKPDVPLPPPKPSPEGSVELPGPPEEPPSPKQPEPGVPGPSPTPELPGTPQPPSAPDQSTPGPTGGPGEGYDYPKPARPFAPGNS